METKNVISLKGKFLKENNDFLIAAHHAPDGDNIGASIGMYLALKNSGKQAVIVNDDKIVERYVFLLDNDKGAFVQYHDDLKDKKYKNVIILDTATCDRVGKVRNIIDEDACTINIDHHPTNELFGTLNYVDSSYASASQLVYRILKENGYRITKRISDALLSGVLSDTGGLRFENTDAKVLSSVQEFIACGSDLTDITDRIFMRLDYDETIKVSEIASKIELLREERIAIAYNDQTANPLYENEPVLMILNSITEAGVSLFVRKNGDDFYKISIRSKGGFNVSDFAAKWNGGGHKNAAGIKFYGSYDKLRNTLLKDLREECLRYYAE